MNRPGSENNGANEPVRLGALESQVMDAIWAEGRMTVREIISLLPTDPAYTTIATVLANLRKKGLVLITKEGRTAYYGACVRKEEHAAQIMSHALDSSGDREASMLHFVNRMPDSDIDVLQRYLSKHRGTEGQTGESGI